MAQHDMNIANQSFPDFRTDLNNALSAINTMHSGSSRPSGAAAGTMWLDTTSASSPTIKFYDGSDDISFATINYSANTVNFLDSTVVADLVGDTSPQLGGNLDVNGNDIVSTSNADIDIIPNGTGDVNLGADTVQVGDNNANATITTQGTGDLTLNTNNGTNSGSIVIADGANGAIDLTTNGTGAIKFNDMAYVPQQAITSSSNAVAWDAQAKSNAYHVTTENTTFSAPSNAVEGAFICVEINYNGSHTIAWNTVFEFAASTEPTTTDTDAKTDIFVFRYNGAVWQEVGRTLNLSESQNMWALVEDNIITKMIGNPKGLVIGDTRYSKNIFSFRWTDEEREAIGIYSVVFDDSNKKNIDYYINTEQSYTFEDGQVTASYGTATPKQLADITDENGYIVKGLKTKHKEIIKEQASNLLEKTDWHNHKALDDDTYTIPANIKTYRADVRTKSNEMETAIDNASDVDALASLYKYTEQEDGSRTRPLGEWPILEV